MNQWLEMKDGGFLSSNEVQEVRIRWRKKGDGRLYQHIAATHAQWGEIELRRVPALGEVVPNATVHVVALLVSVWDDGQPHTEEFPIVGWRTSNPDEFDSVERADPILPGYFVDPDFESLMICDTVSGQCWGGMLETPLPRAEAIAEAARMLDRGRARVAAEATS